MTLLWFESMRDMATQNRNEPKLSLRKRHLARGTLTQKVKDFRLPVIKGVMKGEN
jgi:hypothetical protein